MPGLNPVVTSSRLQGCAGLDYQWFIMTYWCCPVVGWLLATCLDPKTKKTKAKSSSKQSSTANGTANGVPVGSAKKANDAASSNGTAGGKKKKE